MKIAGIIILVCFACSACTEKNAIPEQKRLAYYFAYSKNHLAADFKMAKVAYPPKQLALLIFKQGKQMQMYANDGGRWRYVKTFKIKAASGGLGPKLHEGDHQVPEGVYHITALNPNSHYFLSMKIDYPNLFDRAIAKAMHRYHLGGNIFIHGRQQSVGCIAIGDSGIEQLFPLVETIGIQNVQVIIAPNDIRYERPQYGKVHPHWLTILYHKIRLALSNFPLHRGL